MTAALDSTGAADIYSGGHILLFIFVLWPQILHDVITALNNASLLHQKHHNLVSMSILHPPSDLSTGFCATVSPCVAIGLNIFGAATFSLQSLIAL